MSPCICLSPPPSASAHENSIRRNKLIILVSLLFIVICVFIIVGVSRIVEIGSVAFFVIIVTGSLVFMCFFFALVALAKSVPNSSSTAHHTVGAAGIVGRSNNSSGQGVNDDDDDNNNSLPQVPVFYFLETIHRKPNVNGEEVKNVPDDSFWEIVDHHHPIMSPPIVTLSLKRSESQKDVCAICLCDFETTTNSTGISNCCKRRLHVKCAQKYFNVVQRVQCPLCRHLTLTPPTGDNSLISSSPSPPV